MRNLETHKKKMRRAKKLANNKNPQFLSNSADILAIFSINEYLDQFLPISYHNDWIKIMDSYYWLISGPVSFFSDKSLYLAYKMTSNGFFF